MTTWRKLISEAMLDQGEAVTDIIATTLQFHEADIEFDSGYGGTNGQPFTLWTARRVYFPVCYDGAEWVASVPRSPCSEKTEHVGGG